MNNPITEAGEVVDNLLQGHGRDLRARACLQNVFIEITPAIWTRSIANAEAEGRSCHTSGFRKKRGGDEDTIRMHNLNTAFRIIHTLGGGVSAADVTTLQNPDVRTAVMKNTTKAILDKLIQEH
jgi:hypothetical protein